MIYSYSALSTYLNCPRHFFKQYVTKEFRSTMGPEAARGVRIHGQIEAYLNFEGEESAIEDKPQGNYHVVLRKLGAKPEVAMAFTGDLKPCDFWDKNARLRGKIDVFLKRPREIIITDWKAGKRRTLEQNMLQARTYSCMSQIIHPGKVVSVVFDYLSKGRLKPYVGKPDDKDYLLGLMDSIDRTTSYPPRPSGLCGWCPVKDCEYNKERV